MLDPLPTRDCGNCGGVGATGDEGEGCRACDGSGESRHGGRPFGDLRSTSLLWLVNRVVFHPRGFALSLTADASGDIVGWDLLGDGTEVWTFTEDRDDHHFANAQRALAPRQGGGDDTHR